MPGYEYHGEDEVSSTVPQPPKAPLSAPMAYQYVEEDALAGVSATPDPDALRSSLTLASDVNPEEEAKRRKYARQLGTVPSLVPDFAEAEAELRKRTDPMGLSDNSPRLAKWLTDQKNADIGSRSIDESTRFEQGIKALENIPKPKTFGAVVENALGRAYYNSIFLAQSATAWARGTLGDRVGAVSTLQDAIKTQEEIRRFPAATTLDTAFKTPAHFSTFMLEGFLENIGALSTSIAGGVIGREVGLALATRGAKEVTDKLVSRYALAGATTGAAATSVGMETGGIYADIFQKTGELREGTALAFGTAAGALDALLPIRALRTAYGDKIANEGVKTIAERYGVEAVKALAVEGGTEFFQTWIESGAVSYVDGRPLLNKENLYQAVEAALKGAGAGGIVQVGAQGIQDISTAMETRAATQAAEEAKQRAMSKWSNLIVQHGERALAAQNAVQGDKMLRELSKQAIAHPVRNLDPDAFHSMVSAMTEEDGAVSEVYVAASDLRSILETSGITTAELNLKLPGLSQQIADAIETGNDVHISTADYMTHLAGSPIEESLLPRIKVSPDGMTYKQSQDFAAVQEEELKTQVETLMREDVPVLSEEAFIAQQASLHPEAATFETAYTPEAQAARLLSMPEEEVKQLQDSIAKVKASNIKPGQSYAQYRAEHANREEAYVQDVKAVQDAILNDLQATGRFPADINKVQALPLVHFYTTMAQRQGVSPSEAYSANPLRVNRQVGGGELYQGGAATIEDFKPENIGSILQKTDWAILTAENPNNAVLSAEENAARMLDMRQKLDELGIKYTNAWGKYGEDLREADTVIVFGVDDAKALELGRMFGQESVLTRGGLVYQDGSRNPPTGNIEVMSTVPEVNYTRIPETGAIFSMEINWDNTLPAVNPDVVKPGEVSVKGVHFTHQQRDFLDGRKYGTGIAGAERQRVMESPDPRIKERVDFYVDEGQEVFPEEGLGYVRYDIPLGNLYDAAADPLKLKSSDRFSINRDIAMAANSAFESAILDAGFDGYYSPGGGARQGRAVVLGNASRQISTKPVIAGVIYERPELVGQRASDYIASNYEEAKARYEKANTSAGGVLTLDADNARELFPEYAESNETRTLYAAAVHNASSALMKRMLAEKIAEPVREGAVPVVVFSAGGSGSGKKAAFAVEGMRNLVEQAYLVYDSTLSKFDIAVEHIDAVIASGKNAIVNYVMRDPVEALAKGTLPRAMLNGRVAPLEAHARTHVNAANTIRKLVEHYKGNPKVEINILDNTRGLGEERIGSIDDLVKTNYTDVVPRLHAALEEEYQNGRITKEIYEATKGEAVQPEGVLTGIGGGSYLQSTVSEQERAIEAERAAVRKKYEGTDWWLKAPNGKPTHLTEAQWVDVRTPSFKAWFGDWEKHANKGGAEAEGSLWADNNVSKVVNPVTREPLVVYHGTMKGGFTSFSSTDQRSKTPGAHFFTDDKYMAGTYSGKMTELELLENANEEGYEPERGLYPVFLNLRNPRESNFEGANWDGQRYGQYMVLDPTGDLHYSEGRAYFNEQEASTIVEDLGDDWQVQRADSHYETTDQVVREAQETDGYNDGATIFQVTDDGGRPSGYAGEPADVFVVFLSNQIKHANQNIGAYHPFEYNILKQTTKGAFDPSQLVISFMQGADLSTLTHESAHLYLEMLERMSRTPGAPEQIVHDYEKALGWFGVSREAWEQMGIEQRRPHHEQWAESYELYVLEGKASSLELQGAFSRIRAWMLDVYSSIKAFLDSHPAAGKLNDEVRGIFDRLLATDEAIRVAEETRGYAPLFETAEQAGIPVQDYEAYVRLGSDSTASAEQTLSGKVLRDIRWMSNAKNKHMARLQKEATELRAEVKREVTAEVMAEPINLARRFLRTGEMLDPSTGEEIKVEVGHKLNTDALREMYPTGGLVEFDLADLRGLTNIEGLHPDLVAKMFGFSSGDALVQELLQGENAQDKIEGLTDQRMLERHGEFIDQRAIERAAEMAIHNDTRARFLATGLSILTKSPVPVRQLLRAAKEAAQRAIASKRVRDLRPLQYSAAEAKANKDALKLVASDPRAAVQAQRAALLNNQLSREASGAVDEIQKGIKALRKFENKDIRRKIDLEYLEQIDALLAPFDMRVGLTLKEIDRRKSLTEWVENQEAMGAEPAIDVAAIEEARRKSYKDMTVEEVRGLLGTIRQIEHFGRWKKKLLKAKDAREFAIVMEAARVSIADNANRTAEERGTPADVVGLTGQWVRQIVASHRKFASFMREFDGGKDGGAMFDLFLRGMNDSGNTEATMRAEATQRLAELFKPVLKPVRKSMGAGGLYAKKMLIPGTDISLTHEQRLMFAMNWGNEGNRQRLLDGGLTGKRALSSGDAQKILDTLNQSEWDFVQSVWDYLSTFRPLVAAQERVLTGAEPAWVEPAPITTKYGVYRGGYFPAKYDAELSSRSEALEAATDLRAGMKGAFGASAARNSYAKQRAEAVVGRPLLLNFNTIATHVNEVIHRLAWQEWLIDANRSLKALDGTIREYYGAEVLRELKETVKDVAQGDTPASTPVEKALNHLRVGSTVVGMGWKVTTALLQPSGLAQSWSRVGGAWVTRGLKQYLKNPMKTTEWVREKSPFMQTRGQTMYREINEILNTVRAGEKMSAVKASYFTLIAKMQSIVDVPTWLGAYEKGLADLNYEGATNEDMRKVLEEKATAMADQAVVDSQSGGQIKDLARVQRGHPALKLFTNFYSYFSATYNLNVEAYRRTSFKSPSEIGLFAVDMLLLNTVPVLFSMALKEALKGECDWELDCLAERLGYEQLSFLFGQMILLRDLGTAVEVATGGNNYGYGGPSGLRFFSDMYKFGQQVSQEDADLPLFKVANNVAGTILHYPAGAVNNFVEGAAAIEDGSAEGWAMFPALIAGAPK